jgi:penicillin-binding protein 2
VFYYNLGIRTGPLNIEKYARLFRFGAPTGIPLSDEKSGNVFGPSKRAANKSYWYIGDTLNLSIGQGEMLVTPIQLAQVYAALANGGVFWRPYYVDRIVAGDGQTLFKSAPEKISQVELKERTWALIREGLKEVVLEGTGQSVKIDGVEIFGKTGTAQNPHGKDHAWFVAFAGLPGEPAEIAVVVLVEHGLHGASAAAPIARDIILASLRGRLPERRALPRVLPAVEPGPVTSSTSPAGPASLGNNFAEPRPFEAPGKSPGAKKDGAGEGR